MPIAVDLGTNTFTMVVAKVNGDEIEVLRTHRAYVFLLEHSANHIGQRAWTRATKALEEFAEIKAEYPDEPMRIVGTAGLRSADNSDLLLAFAKNELGLDIEIIDGDEEAHLIFEGIRHGGALEDELSLMMDIGGGSVEFILGSNKGMLWAQSYNVGVGVMAHQIADFQTLTPESLAELHVWLSSELAGLQAVLQQHGPIKTFVLASGFFPYALQFLGIPQKGPSSDSIPIGEYNDKFESNFIYSTPEKRANMLDIPQEKVGLMALSIGLVNFVLGLIPMESLRGTDWMLKEGLIFEMHKKEVI